MTKLMVLVIFTIAARAQSLDFSNQGKVPGSRGVEAWAVSGCPGRPIQIGFIYGMASKHNVRWMAPRTAAENFTKKSPWSRAVRIAGFASAGGAALTGFDVVKARPQVVAGLAIGGALLVVLVPMAQKEVPTVDATFGRDLLVGVDGCGTTYFYAFPSNVTLFAEAVPQ